MKETGEIGDYRIARTRDRFTALFWGRPRMRILLEASTESEWVAQQLETFGDEAHLLLLKTERRVVATLTAPQIPALASFRPNQFAAGRGERRSIPRLGLLGWSWPIGSVR